MVSYNNTGEYIKDGMTKTEWDTNKNKTLSDMQKHVEYKNESGNGMKCIMLPTYILDGKLYSY